MRLKCSSSTASSPHTPRDATPRLLSFYCIMSPYTSRSDPTIAFLLLHHLPIHLEKRPHDCLPSTASSPHTPQEATPRLPSFYRIIFSNTSRNDPTIAILLPHHLPIHLGMQVHGCQSSTTSPFHTPRDTTRLVHYIYCDVFPYTFRRASMSVARLL